MSIPKKSTVRKSTRAVSKKLGKKVGKVFSTSMKSYIPTKPKRKAVRDTVKNSGSRGAKVMNKWIKSGGLKDGPASKKTKRLGAKASRLTKKESKRRGGRG